VFLGLRALGGVGWAMFATVATTTMVNLPGAERRGRTVSLLLMSETLGLFAGSAAGGWLYQGAGAASPFVFEAGCMLVAALAVARWASRPGRHSPGHREASDRRVLSAVLRTPGVLLMGATSAVLIAIQTGVLVFLFPLYLVNRGNIEPRTVGLLVSLSALGRLLALWVGGGVSDRWGRLPVLVPGLTIYAALLGSMAFLVHPVALGIWSLGIGAAAGFVAALPTAIIGDQVPAASRGMAIGWLRTMTDGGQIVGPLVMGALADAVDLSAAFLFGALLLVATAWQCHRRAGSMSPAPAGGSP
jgi:MFS family permease